MTEKKTNQVRDKREAPISWRPPAALRAEFHERVERSGLSANAYITKAVFGAGSPDEKALLAHLLGQAAEIRDALHDITLGGGDTPTNTLHIEAAFDELTAIRAALLELLRRWP